MTPKGEWDSTISYERLDVVTYSDCVWVARKPSTNVPPVDGEYWMYMCGVVDMKDFVVETTLSGTLEASNWSGTTYTLNNASITSTVDGSIGIANNATLEQRTATRKAMISVVSQAEGSITLVADGTIPTIDIPVTITLLREPVNDE